MGGTDGWGGPSKHNCRTIVICWFDDDYVFRSCLAIFRSYASLQLTIIKRKHIHYIRFYLAVLYSSGVQRDLVVNGILLVRAL
jgi:hypothetical protein